MEVGERMTLVCVAELFLVIAGGECGEARLDGFNMAAS